MDASSGNKQQQEHFSLPALAQCSTRCSSWGEENSSLGFVPFTVQNTFLVSKLQNRQHFLSILMTPPTNGSRNSGKLLSTCNSSSLTDRPVHELKEHTSHQFNVEQWRAIVVDPKKKYRTLYWQVQKKVTRYPLYCLAPLRPQIHTLMNINDMLLLSQYRIGLLTWLQHMPNIPYTKASNHLRQGSGLAHAHLPAFLHPTTRSHNKPLTLKSETLLFLQGSESTYKLMIQVMLSL